MLVAACFFCSWGIAPLRKEVSGRWPSRSEVGHHHLPVVAVVWRGIRPLMFDDAHPRAAVKTAG
jgi:hypothetical protein